MSIQRPRASSETERSAWILHPVAGIELKGRQLHASSPWEFSNFVIRFLNVSLNVPVIPFLCFPIDDLGRAVARADSSSIPSREMKRTRSAVLLDGSALPQVTELRPSAPGSLLDLAVELRDGDHRDVELLREVLQPAADLRHFLRPVLVPSPGSRYQLEVVDDQEVDAVLEREPLRLRPHLEHGQVRGVVDIDVSVRQDRRRLADLRPVVAVQVARPGSGGRPPPTRPRSSAS